MADSKMIIMNHFSRDKINFDGAIDNLKTNINHSALVILLDPSLKTLVEDICSFILEKKSPTTVLVCTTPEHFYTTLDRLSFLNAQNEINRGKIRLLILGDDFKHSDMKPIEVVTGVCKVFKEEFNAPMMVYCQTILSDVPIREKLQTIDPLMEILAYKSTEIAFEKIKYYAIAATLIWISEIPVEKEISDSMIGGIKLVTVKTQEEVKNYLTANKGLAYHDNLRIVYVWNYDKTELSREQPFNMVKLVRETCGMKAPLLIYCKPSVAFVGTKIYQYPRVWALDKAQGIIDFVKMKPLVWAPNILSDGTSDSNWSGTLTLYDASARGLGSKKKTKFVLKVGETEKETDYVTDADGNPTWNSLLWQCPAKANDTIKLEIIEKAMKKKILGCAEISVLDMMGEVSFSCLNVARVFPLSVPTKITKSSKKHDEIEGNSRKSSKKLIDKNTDEAKGIVRVTIGFSAGNQQGKKKHFGLPIEVSKQNAQKDGQVHFLTKLLSTLSAQGGNTEGLFRVPGNKNAIHRLVNQVDAGLEINYSVDDEFTLIGLLKNYLMELPECIITEKVFNLLKEVNLSSPDAATIIKKTIDENLPKDVYDVVRDLCHYFYLVMSNKDTTKMGPNTIAIAIGPSIMLSPKLRRDPLAFIELNANVIGPLLSFMIVNTKLIFPK